ncbi:pyruvate kinase [Desulfovibrio ferrophilus]|uniref:Pyruvate kinase n=1 Tax=Desulfovibrio ferrophilus TaxID=241368 RepID=A0A2Z6B3M2_9BACT|nr:pyruvate kinase [Desulfovibrio ferrophilus]BBD10055.1 pyruvate kinase [Desulfovibrio ferrophilus]
MRTKIIATLGPASMEKDVMRAMVDHGVRIFRLNFSHADAEYFRPIVQTIREIEQEVGFPLTAMGDLCGPKIRIGQVIGSPCNVSKGDVVCLGLPDMRGGAPADALFIELGVPELLDGLSVGEPVFLSDGMLQFTITRVLEQDKMYLMEAQNGSILTSNKGIAFPDKVHPMPALTEKDRKDLSEALAIGVDALALSFVQTRDDVDEAKELIRKEGHWVPVVAKLERKRAVDNIESIVAAADAIMVARGDLGVECSLMTLPVIQKRIIRACRHQQKAVIVATQMMLSMVKSPVPTRAEAADVANAVMDGADCVMLSEETAIGNHPVETCRFIQGIATSAEEYYLERIGEPFKPSKQRNLVKYMAYSACLVAEQAQSKALIAHSTSGSTARLLSSRRPRQTIFALTPDQRVIRWLNFFWGVKPRAVDPRIESHTERALEFVKTSNEFASGENVVVTSGQARPPGQTEIKTNTIRLFYK